MDLYTKDSKITFFAVNDKTDDGTLLTREKIAKIQLTNPHKPTADEAANALKIYKAEKKARGLIDSLPVSSDELLS